MDKWPWQKWAGKIILLILAGAGALLDLFPSIEIPWWMIILPAATQVAQWFIALIPGETFLVVVGRVLLLLISVVEIVLAGLGVQVEIWLILVPMLSALAQYLISKTGVRS